MPVIQQKNPTVTASYPKEFETVRKGRYNQFKGSVVDASQTKSKLVVRSEHSDLC